MESQVIEVSAGLIFRDGKLLITRRYADAHLGGLWEFPGGKREAGETFEQCLVRELREELGVEVRVGELFDSVIHSYPEKIVRLEVFLCRIIDGEPQPMGCPALKWIPRAELSSYAFPAADQQLVRRLAALHEPWKRESGHRPSLP